MKTMLIATACLFAATAEAQSRAPTYKCATAEKVTYSDEPCVGAKVINTTPTQGLSKLSGQTRKGAEVQRNETNAAMAEAMRPLFGESALQRSTRHHRTNLSNSAKTECNKLDSQIKDSNGTNEISLYQDRKRYKDLKC